MRALVGEDCRLDLVSKSQRRGKPVGTYFARYQKVAVRLAVVDLEGEPALAAYAQDRDPRFPLRVRYRRRGGVRDRVTMLLGRCP